MSAEFSNVSDLFAKVKNEKIAAKLKRIFTWKGSSKH